MCTPPNTCFLGPRPTRVHNSNGISIGSVILHSSQQRYRRARPKIVPSPRVIWTIHGSLGPTESTTQTTSRSVVPFCTAYHTVVGHDVLFLTLRLYMGRSGPQPRAHPSLNRKRHLHRLSRFCMATTVSDQQTDRQTMLLDR